MANPKYTVRLPEPLAGRLDDFREDRGLDRDSEAIRAALANGLDAWEDQDAANDADALLERVAMALAIAGFIAFMGAFTALLFLDLKWWLAPVYAPATLTVVYLVGAWGVNRWAYRRGSA